MPVTTRSKGKTPVKKSGNEDAEARDALETVRSTFRSGKTRSLEWRRNQLNAFAKMCREARDELCEALKEDLHKCKFESYFFEVNQLEHEIGEHLKHMDAWARPRPVSTDLLNLPGSSFIKPDPLGVVCIIGAWNYPILLSLQPLVGAISAGNCVILKMPSHKYSSATSRVVAKLCAKYLDTSAIRVLEGDRHMTQAVLKGKYDKYFFTGGSYVGKMVYEAAARELTPAILELGGKSPCVVDKSCNIRSTAYRLCQGKWTNAGQTCIAPDYLLVHSDVADALFDEMERVTTEFFGDDVKKSDDFGRIINERAWDNAKKLLDESVDAIRFGGKGADRSEKFIPPTVFDYGTDMKRFEKAPLMQDEIFAPLLPAYRWNDFDEIVDFVMSRDKPLSFYIYANDSSLVRKAYELTTSGAFVNNDCLTHMSNHKLPFGGVGKAGMGAYHGKHTFDAFSHLKACMLKPAWADLLLRPFRYPKAGRSNACKNFVFRVTYCVQYPYSILPNIPLFGLILKSLFLAFLFNLGLGFEPFRNVVSYILVYLTSLVEAASSSS